MSVELKNVGIKDSERLLEVRIPDEGVAKDLKPSQAVRDFTIPGRD